MIHVVILLAHVTALGFLAGALAGLVARTWRESALVAVPVICEEPARSHVESGVLSFVPFVHVHIQLPTMRAPEGPQ